MYSFDQNESEGGRPILPVPCVGHVGHLGQRLHPTRPTRWQSEPRPLCAGSACATHTRRRLLGGVHGVVRHFCFCPLPGTPWLIDESEGGVEGRLLKEIERIRPQ